VCVSSKDYIVRCVSAEDSSKPNTEHRRPTTDSCIHFNFGFSMKVDQAEVDYHTDTHAHIHTHTHIYIYYRMLVFI